MTKTAICNVSAVYPNVSVEKYAIMPDHVHLMLLLQDGTRPLSTIIRGIKTAVSKQCGHTIWQKSYYEHVIRTDAEFLAIWKYIDENPMALYCDK